MINVFVIVYSSPLALTSFDMRVISKVSFIRCSTASVKSESKDCTRFGKTHRLCAVCSDDARSDRFYPTDKHIFPSP